MPSVATLPQRQTQVLDYPLSYTEAGCGDLLLLIHGSLCDYRYWRWQIPALSEQYHIVAPSLRGYWPNAFESENASFSIAQHAQDMLELIGQFGNKPVHILGHSRGAHVALEIACTQPRLVKSLTLADPGFRIGPDAGSHTFQLDAVKKLQEGNLEAALTEFIDTVSGPGTWRHMVSWFKTMVRDNARTLLSQINETQLQFDTSRAKAVTAPVLLLGGANSPARYARVQDALEPNFTHVQRDTIALASHGMNLGNPKAFNARVAQFLTEASSSAYWQA